MSATHTVVHLCCGAGGGGIGFKRAGFHGLAAIDNDPQACRDYERFVGEPATCADLAELTPADLRKIAGPVAPSVLFSSAPCKGFSGCLPGDRAKLEKYVSESPELDLALTQIARMESPCCNAMDPCDPGTCRDCDRLHQLEQDNDP